MDIEQTAILIRDAIRDLPKQYNRNYEEIGKLDEEQQDILHYIELGKRLGTVQSHDPYMQIRKLRIKRRKLKNENEQLEGLVSILKKFAPYLNDLNRTIGDIRRTKDIQANRQYKCRVRDDLQEKMTS